MFKKVIISLIIIAGFVFMALASNGNKGVCEVNNSESCWQYEDGKGWIYNAPTIQVVSETNGENWQFDEKLGWVFQAEKITVLS